jgi:hypothetical protein
MIEDRAREPDRKTDVKRSADPDPVNSSLVESLAEEPWILAPAEFSAPLAPVDAFPGTLDSEGRRARQSASSSFLGKAVGGIHESITFWSLFFEDDPYVMNILKEGFKIPVKMDEKQRFTIYRERNNQSARNDMAFVREEVDRLVKAGQVVRIASATTCTNPLSVAYKVNADGSIKKRLVIDLSRRVNIFVTPDSYRMSRFQDALSQLSAGDFQAVFDVSKAYHHLRLAPESYDLVGFCVPDEDGKDYFYHFVVVVFGLGPAGQALSRVMKPILIHLASQGIRNMMYVDDGYIVASSKKRADTDYAYTLAIFKAAGFCVSEEKSDPIGSASMRKEYLGFVINTEDMTVHVPAAKLARIKNFAFYLFREKIPQGASCGKRRWKTGVVRGSTWQSRSYRHEVGHHQDRGRDRRFRHVSQTQESLGEDH